MKAIPKGSTVLIAIKPGRHAPLLLKNAFNMIGALECNAVVATIVEPFNDRYMHNVYGIPGQNAQITAQIDKERVEAAKILLEKELKHAPANVHVEMKSFLGHFRDEVINLAEKTGASAIVIGSKRSYSFLESSASNTISVMENSPVPVVVFPNETEFNNKKGLNLLVCDDMAESGDSALTFSRAFAKSHASISLNHLTVIDSDDSPSDGLEHEILEKFNLNHAKSSAEELKEQLNNRFSIGFSKADLETISYKSVVRTGNTIEEIRVAASEEKTDFIVFGRHLFLKFSPFGIGNVSWASMVTMKKPIIVCKG